MTTKCYMSIRMSSATMLRAAVNKYGFDISEDEISSYSPPEGMDLYLVFDYPSNGTHSLLSSVLVETQFEAAGYDTPGLVYYIGNE